MSRCTEWRGEHAAVMDNKVNYIDRLARYEDTGLEPEEVTILQAQQYVWKNEPLTLEQLQSMDCHPVFIVEGKNRGWAIVDWHGVNKSWMYFSKTGTAEGMSAKAVFARDYGTDWLAYRRPPGWPGGGYDEGSGST